MLIAIALFMIVTYGCHKTSSPYRAGRKLSQKYSKLKTEIYFLFIGDKQSLNRLIIGVRSSVVKQIRTDIGHVAYRFTFRAVPFAAFTGKLTRRVFALAVLITVSDRRRRLVRLLLLALLLSAHDRWIETRDYDDHHQKTP